MGSSTEIEAKFDASPEWQLPELDGVVTRDLPTTELVAVYWDTQDGRLDRWGVTLRHRVADGGHGEWTVKLPLRGSTGGVQRRREVTAEGTSEAPPAELQGLLTAMTQGEELEPVAELRTERRRVHAGTDLWSEAVEITDDRVTSRVAGQDGPAFRQIEVELLDADAEEVMESVTAALRDAGLESSPDASKLRRVLGTPTRSDDPKPGDTSAERLASAAIGRGLSTIVSIDPWIRVDDDVHAVHTSRKAVRRLRSDLKTLRPVLDRNRTDPLRDELKWFGGLLGEVRDLHVLREQLVDLAEEAGVPSDKLHTILDVLQQQLAAHRRNLLSAMGGDRYLALIRRLAEFEEQPPLRSGTDPGGRVDDALATSGHKSWKKVKRARRRAEAQPSAERVHTVRKKAKQARAAAKLAKTAGSSGKGRKSAKKFARAASRLKDQLGDLHDADVLVEWLDQLPQRLDPKGAYDAGRLRERAVMRRAELDAAWPEAWEDLDRKRLRRWTS